MTPRTVLVAVAVVVCAGCAARGPGPDDAPSATGSDPTGSATSGSTASGTTGPAGCGGLPTSTGPARGLVSLRLKAPGSAAAGSEIAVEAQVEVVADGGRVITVPATSRLLLVRDGTVVASSGPGTGPAGVPLVLAAGASRPAQAVPGRLVLRACGSDGAPGAALPPGRYGIVAVLAYGQDPLNGAPGSGGGARTFTLVSEPRAITVR